MKHWMVALDECGSSITNMPYFPHPDHFFSYSPWTRSWSLAVSTCGGHNEMLHSGEVHYAGRPRTKVAAYEIVSETEESDAAV